jgi:small subunit ribosomal protein S20
VATRAVVMFPCVVPYSLSPPADRVIPMANIASQKKRIARTERERHENLRFASSVKTHMKRLQAAVSSGDDQAADAEHKALVSRIDKAVQNGAMHRNTGARKKSRAARVRAGS